MRCRSRRRRAAAVVLAHATTYLLTSLLERAPFFRSSRTSTTAVQRSLQMEPPWRPCVVQIRRHGWAIKQTERGRERRERGRGGGTATAVNKSGPTGIRKVFKKTAGTSRPLQSERMNEVSFLEAGCRIRTVGAIAVRVIVEKQWATQSSSFLSRPVHKQVHFPDFDVPRS